mmetsp:Transcript_19587/g.42542  ORF Transcript_19587/g.42542 Transcript_19587/m.42542 type:complete len:388 (+) Transcript_19587:177-1340(+)|eukprot:CAMPEP_0172312288 /NCGR_PEP_ID=MMETSP1058-20130122/17109_1 /TAXON_ID=83371 /ORGANISM="Detonula confervacea, Strain CCMP 353" /LENGTH=387 /DNA_ID=CAMNT_0013025699 /DNA_START=85 /DNA_END=1248 /DNA_ORIENTATION=-
MTFTWSLDPLVQKNLPKEVIVSVLEDIDFFRIVFVIFIILSLVYPIAHRILKRFVKNYDAIDSSAKRMVVLHHAVEAVILTVATPLFTYYMVKASLTIHDNDEDPISILADIKLDVRNIFLLCMLFITLYMYELSSRYESPRVVLIIHHLMAILDGFLVITFPTSIMLKTCSVLVYSICFEAATFAGLFMYRMYPLNKWTPRMIMSGIVIFGVTRPIQLLWVGAAAFGSWGDSYHVKWQAILQFTLTCFFTIIQVWSLTINFGIWGRSCAKINMHQANMNRKTFSRKPTDQTHHTSSSEEEGDGILDDNMDDYEDSFEEFVAFLKQPVRRTSIVVRQASFVRLASMRDLRCSMRDLRGICVDAIIEEELESEDENKADLPPLEKNQV